MKKLIAILAVCALTALGMAQSTNVLRNPGFEADPAGESQSFPGWAPYGPTYGPVVHTNAYSESGTGLAHGGVSCLKVTPDLTTYNINFNGVYQDYLSGPGATYAAGGWVYAPSANLLAGRNSAWLEVTFRDANANVLALYCSAIVTNVAGGAFPQNTWVDLPVTNACDPATLVVTGTVSQLVAPAGTYFVRYRVVVRGDGSGSGGWLYFDDLQLDLTGGTPYSGWNMAWSDEFNGTTVDANTWTYDIGDGSGVGQPGKGWGNSELEYYTSRTNNVYEAGGMLHIVAQQESYGGSSYTSARVKSQGLFSAKYGRIEWRAKLPVGTGCWPALWLLGTNISTVPWPGCGEIDMMENRGTDPTIVQASTHSGGNGGSDGYGNDGGIYQFISGQETNAASAFHTYTMDWSTNAIMFYADGHLYATVKNWSSSVGNYPVPFNQPFFFIMNLAIGGAYLGWPSEASINAGTAFPVEMDVDYLRVYQLTNTALVTLPPPPPAQPIATNSVLVDFDSGATNDVTPSPNNGFYWNSVLAAQTGGTSVPLNGSTQPISLVNAANANSGMTLAISCTGWGANAGASWGDYTGAYGYPSVLGDIPSTALRDGMSISGGATMTVTLAGLNPGSTYNVLIYGATVNASSGNYTDLGNAQSNTLTLGSSTSPASVRFNAYYNSAMVGTWTNVTPNVSGQIALTITVPSGGSGGAFNFMEISPTSTNPSNNAPPSPTGLGATAGNGQVALTWTASTGATSYNVKRATTSGGETTITNVTGVSYTDTSAVNGTTYYYVVSALNANGESANSAEVSAMPQGTAVSTVAVLVDFDSGDAGDVTASPDVNGNYWNSIVAAQTGGGAVNLNGGAQPVALLNSGNGASGWTLGITNLSGWNASALASWEDYGGPWPAAVSNFPVTALRDGIGISGAGVSVTLSGLDHGSTYNVLTYGADGSSYGPQGPQTNTLTVGSSLSLAAVSFIPYNNATTVVAWTNVAPDAAGRIVLTIVGSGMLNFMEVSQVAGSAQPPARAHLTNGMSGNTLNLSWPAGQGWRLLGQTNHLSPTGWQPVSGTADGSDSIIISASTSAVFYRLVYP